MLEISQPVAFVNSSAGLKAQTFKRGRMTRQLKTFKNVRR